MCKLISIHSSLSYCFHSSYAPSKIKYIKHVYDKDTKRADKDSDKSCVRYGSSFLNNME